MSRITKWKLEKTKVKVVFRLQFHATHIPQSGWDKLFISFIPTDSGKATAKTTKANVRNGTCKWGDPIYETTRLLQDAQSKQYDDKLYKFVVAMGSSRSSVLGEASINLADYADAQKPSAVALPLHGCNSGTTLHVTIQLLTSKTGFREFEQQRELRERGLQTGTDLNRNDGSGSGKRPLLGETANDHIDKVNTRVRFRPESKELPSLEEEVGLNEEYADSAVGFDGSSNTSGSLYAEKHETSSTHEIDSIKSAVSGDLNGSSHCQSPQTEKGDTADHRILAPGSSDWIHGWGSDYSVDNDLAIVYEENNRLRGCLEVAESSILELKLDISTLQSQADQIGVDTQTFSQQLGSEIASGEELAKDVTTLKSDCMKYKDDLQRLKNLKLSPQANQNHLSGDIQLRWLNGLLLMEDKIRELLNKVYIGFHERDFRFLHPDLESLLGVLQDLKIKANGNEIRKTSLREGEQFVSGTGFDVDLCEPEDMLHCLSIPGPTSQQPDSIDATDVLKGKILELLRDLDESKTEKEGLARKMDQMECYYEALVHELEENQKQILGELQNLRNEHSTCLCTIATNEAEMQAMRNDINEQILRFSEERRDLDSINKDLERRAITSEAALKRARLNYSIAVGQLQKDLDLLSFQVLSMFETNENLIKQTYSETSQPCFKGYPDIKPNQEERDITEFLQDQNRNARVRKQISGGDLLLEDLKKSLHFQEDLYQKVEEELSEMHLVNVQLDVFSKTLQETLFDASAGILLMKAKTDELAQQLEFSTESQQLLIRRLQIAMDEVCTLNGDKAGCIAKCNDMVLQNQILEAKLERASNENRLLTQKITEGEELLVKYRVYESKYEACSGEKTELVGLLRKETLENGNLQNEIFCLNEELKTVKAEYDDLASLKDNLHKIVNFMQDKLGSMLASYNNQFGNRSLSSSSLLEDLEFKDSMSAMLQLEEIQNNACEKILQLMKEKKNLEDEIGISRMSLSTAESEMLVVKQKFKHDIHDMVTKLDMSTALVERLQLDLEAIANKVQVSSEAEEKCEQQHKELFSGLSHLEVELQQLTCKNADLSQEILGLETITDELGRCKLTIAELMKEKQDMMTSLEAKTEESIKLACEIDGLKENLRFLHDERDISRTSLTTAESETWVVKQKFKYELQDMVTKLNMFNALVGKLQLDLEAIANKLHAGSETQEKYEQQNEELFSGLARLDVELQQLNFKNVHLSQEVLGLETITDELERCKLTIAELMKEKQDLMTSLEAQTEESIKLACEMDGLKENLKFLHDERDVSRESSSIAEAETRVVKQKLKHEIQDMVAKLDLSNARVEKLQLELEAIANKLQVSSEADEKYEEQNKELFSGLAGLEVELQQLAFQNRDFAEEILGLDTIGDELRRCKLTITELMHEKQDLMTSLEAKSEESVKLACELDSLKENFRFLHDELDVERSFRDKLESTVTDLNSQFDEKVHKESSCLTDLKIQLSEMHQSLLAADVEVTFIRTQYKSRIGELHKKYLDLEAMLNRCLDSESLYAQENVKLIATIESMKSELEAYFAQNTILSDSNNVMMGQLEEYKKRVANFEFSFSEDEIDNLVTSKEELEIRTIVLKAQLDEQQAQMNFLDQSNNELMILRSHCNDLSRRLSEQILKTEEFKNLSIHLKELKDKAEAESLEARVKKEPEGPPVMQESLRIVFIKEQYETRLQELKHQLSISKRHAEEMLLKLQDAIDEIQNRKKSEASHLRRNEELSLKILELEAELQSFASDKREKLKTSDRIKAELDCALLSLECCKEEKQKLEASLQECEEEKSRVAVELNLTKGLLKRSASFVSNQEENGGSDKVKGALSAEAVIGKASPKYSDLDSLVNGEDTEDGGSILASEREHLTSPNEDVPVPKGVRGIPRHAFLDQGASPLSDSKHLAFINDNFKTQSLKSSMDHLHEELERMKNENSLLPQNDNHFDPNILGLERELMQLNKANEELGSIYPFFNEFSGSGNALERVLALEMELAEALRAKKKSSINFQSSFLKQHGDEEAVFQSFRDINELIKDMLELKGRYATVDTELREMHDRYSQLSLQFAEVEGERQKLMMTLKNVRASKKLMHLNRSLSDHPS